MIWIEMSRDETHGGGEWGFAKCVWAPTYKKSKNPNRRQAWPFWKNVSKVRNDDIVLHLRGKGATAAFVGYSLADGKGHATKEKPPTPGDWGYCESYYRAFLKGYSEFDTPIYLSDLFVSYGRELANYYGQLVSTPKNVFFTIQAKKLQCLNGAYFTIADQQLLTLIFNVSDYKDVPVAETIPTSEAWRKIKQRSGQSQFSRNVKKNYGYNCCFKDCTIDDPNYLVGSHIARWADNPLRRGDIDNGLCFCLMHDKAFELGDFSLDDEYRILLTKSTNRIASHYFQESIAPYAGSQIRLGEIKPNIEALREHRQRCNLK